MDARMKKRLEKIEQDLAPPEDLSGVVFIPLKGESEKEMDERMARWFAGERVEGQDRLCNGREPMVARIRVVSSAVSRA